MSSDQLQSPIVQSVEISIQNLVRSCNRRRKWRNFFNPNMQFQDTGGRAPWRIHLAKFLESTLIHLISLSLLLIDLVLSILQLSSSLVSCTPKRTSEKATAWYHWFGISILILLCAKSAALVVGLGTAFFKKPGYVVDGAVVVAALVLEEFLESKGGGLVIIVSLWRVLRVVESAFELSDEAIEGQVQEILAQFEALREENTRLQENIAEKDRTIEELHRQLDYLNQTQLSS